jgi:hypothetical protein
MGAGLAGALLIGVVAPVGIASAASPAASLKITVPAKVRPGQHYEIKIAGLYAKSATQGTAYLVAFLQYTATACKPTAGAENDLPSKDWSLDFAGKEPQSPFTRIDRWTTGTLTGTRKVCAYLYPKAVSPSTKLHPIAIAAATYRNV